MDVLDISMLSIGQVREIISGTKKSSKNFFICNDMQWGGQSPTHYPYRANAAAFVLCTEGEMTLSIGIKRHHLHKNTIMLYGPGNIIEIYECSSDFKAHLLVFTREFTQGALLDLQAVMPIYQYLTEESNDFLHLEPEETEILQQYIGLLNNTVDRYSEGAVYNLIASMFRTVSDIYSRRISQTEVSKPRTRQEEYFERFMLEVSKHHRTERSVQFYADTLHITPKYLSTIIKEVSGRSAAEWIDEFVIQEAKVLLKYSPKSIQEITYYLNFSTQSFFGKYFKRHVGLSPSQYRNS